MKFRVAAIVAVVAGALLGDAGGLPVSARFGAGRRDARDPREFFTDTVPGAAASGDSGRAAPRERPAGARPVIVIDPGHPSEKGAGANGHGVAEVHAAWEVALRLRDSLAAAGYEVRMTKAAERQLVRNVERARTANAAGAALMVRLHCDVGSGTGFTLYYPDRQGTAEGRTGPSHEVMERSRTAALVLDSGMAARLSPRYLRDGGVLGDSRTFVGSQQGALTGSIFSEVPVVTVEMAVLTDAGDARFIGSGEGQARMAGAIAEGVRRLVSLSTRKPATQPPAPEPPAPLPPPPPAPATDSSAAPARSDTASHRPDSAAAQQPKRTRRHHRAPAQRAASTSAKS